MTDDCAINNMCAFYYCERCTDDRQRLVQLYYAHFSACVRRDVMRYSLVTLLSRLVHNPHCSHFLASLRLNSASRLDIDKCYPALCAQAMVKPEAQRAIFKRRFSQRELITSHIERCDFDKCGSTLCTRFDATSSRRNTRERYQF